MDFVIKANIFIGPPKDDDFVTKGRKSNQHFYRESSKKHRDDGI